MTKAVFREPDRERLTEAGFTGVDMHFHTDCSPDSLARIDLTLRTARKLGIGVAITDHNDVRAAVNYVGARGVLVVPGVELTSREGCHTILYFTSKRDCQEWARKVLAPLKKTDPYRLPASTMELYESAARYNAIICSPHPFSTGITGICKGSVTRAMERKIDVVEGINAYLTRKMNLKALAWAERIGKPVTAGSDGHVVAELGQGLTFCEADDLRGFLDEVRRGHSIAMGRENSLYEKARVGLEKEKRFFHSAHHEHHAIRLLRDQFGPEWTYFKKRVKDGMHNHWLRHHE